MHQHHLWSHRADLSLDFVIAVANMDRCNWCADAERREGGDGPLRTVWCGDTDSVALLNSGRPQIVGSA